MKTEEKEKEVLSLDGLLNSELAYHPDQRMSISEMETFIIEEKDIKQLNGNEWNAVIEREILSHQALQLAEANLREVIYDYNELEKKIINQGISKTEQPFVPQYLGFSQGKAEQGNTIYIKGDVGLASTPKGWLLFGLHSTPIHLKIDNMYQGTEVLRALGVDVCND